MTGPCKHCPFRRDVEPYLTAERGLQLALLTRNPKGRFTCHETIKRLGGKGPPRLCIGFALLRGQEAGHRFVTAADGVYLGMGEMIAAYAGAQR